MSGTVLCSRIFPARTFWMLLLALAVLPPAPVHAQGTSEVQAYLVSVKRLYEDLENESALKLIARAKALPRTKNEDVTLSLYEGVIQADLSHWEESAAAFKVALAQHPEAQLPVKVSPKVQQHFETVRQQVKQELAAAQKPPPPPKPVTPPPDRPVNEQRPEPVASKALPEPKPAPPADLTQTRAPSADGPLETVSLSFTRPQVLGPAIGGGVLLVLGGTSWALSRRELSRLNNDGPGLATPADAQQASSRGRTFQSVGVGLMGVGVAGLGFAYGWYAFGPPSSEMALTVGTDGTSAFVQGRWP